MDFRRYTEYLPVSPIGVLQSLAIGLIVGFLTYVGYLGIQQFALEPVFCQSNNARYCSITPNIGIVLSIVIFHFLGLVALVRVGVIRPLLVVLATIITLLGFHAWFAGQSWWIGALYLGLLTGFSYLYFSWINRMSAFPVALGLTLISLVAVRLLVAYL